MKISKPCVSLCTCSLFVTLMEVEAFFYSSFHFRQSNIQILGVAVQKFLKYSDLKYQINGLEIHLKFYNKWLKSCHKSCCSLIKYRKSYKETWKQNRRKDVDGTFIVLFQFLYFSCCSSWWISAQKSCRVQITLSLEFKIFPCNL